MVVTKSSHGCSLEGREGMRLNHTNLSMNCKTQPIKGMSYDAFEKKKNNKQTWWPSLVNFCGLIKMLWGIHFQFFEK